MRNLPIRLMYLNPWSSVELLGKVRALLGGAAVLEAVHHWGL